MNMGTFHSCIMADDRKGILLEFSLPTMSLNLTTVKADAFDLMLKKQNQVCRLKYAGPTYAVISKHEDCVYYTYIEAQWRIRTTKCRNESFTDSKSYYRMTQCTALGMSQMSHLGDLKSSIRLVYVDDVIVLSKTVKQHLSKLKILLNGHTGETRRLIPANCHYMSSYLYILGLLVHENGVSPDP